MIYASNASKLNLIPLKTSENLLGLQIHILPRDNFAIYHLNPKIRRMAQTCLNVC